METSPGLQFLLERDTIVNDRREMVESYIESWDEDDAREASQIRDQIENHGRPLPSTVVVIPVAAHTESKNIKNALGQYARQEGAEPFAVHLHLNWPAAQRDNPGISDTMQIIQETTDEFPDLDIRVSSMEYDDPVIGHIRRVAWNGTLASLLENNPDIAVAVGINHDIDVRKMSRFYIKRVQDYYKKLDGDGSYRPFLQPAATQLKHEYDYRYPNTSRMVFWSDFTNRMYKAGFEAGMVVPFATYAGSGGFNRYDKTYETHRLIRLYAGTIDMIPGTNLETSIRRYLDRLPGHGMRGIWSNDSFGPDDNCRIAEEFQDLTDEQLAQILSFNATEFGKVYMRQLFKYHLTRDEKSGLMSDDDVRLAEAAFQVYRRAMRTMRAAEVVLKNIIDIPLIDDYLRTHFFNETEIWDQAMRHRRRLKETPQIIKDALAKLDATRQDTIPLRGEEAS